MKMILLLIFIATNIRAQDSTKWDKYIVKEKNPFEVDSLVDVSSLIIYEPSKDAQTNLYLADNAINAEDYEKAYSLLKVAIWQGGEDAYTYFQKGFCEMMLDQSEKSVASFTKCIEINNGESFFMREQAIMNIKDNGEVMRGFKFIMVKHRPNEAYYYRAYSKFNLKDYMSAMSDLNKYGKKDAAYYGLIGRCKFSLEDFLGAKTDLTSEIKLSKEDDCKTFGLRAYCNLFLGLKKNACMDWSRSGELGCENAYEHIKEYCNK